jgi:hypothetical protein
MQWKSPGTYIYLDQYGYFAFDFKDNHKQTRLDVIPSLLTQLAARSNHCCELLFCLLVYSLFWIHGMRMFIFLS